MTSLRGHKRREFSQAVRKAAFARCCLRCDVPGVENLPGRPQCENCGVELRSGNIVYEHVQADGLGGEPTADNCKVFCLKVCATRKTVEEDNPIMAKADAVLKKAYGLEAKKRPLRSRGFRPAKPQNTATRPIIRHNAAEG